MKFTTVATAIAAVLILTSCSRSEEEVAEKIDPENELVIEYDIQEEDEEEMLESPYQEVLDYFNSWKLPEEGRAPLNDPSYEEYDPDQFVVYENGYVFDKQSKALSAIILQNEAEAIEPDDNQIPGVVMRYIADVADFGHIEVSHVEDPETFQKSLDSFYTGLGKIQSLSDFPPLHQWAQETSLAFETAEQESDPNKKWEAFSNGLQQLDKMKWLVLK